jgi:type VI secretion system protein ImpL
MFSNLSNLFSKVFGVVGNARSWMGNAVSSPKTYLLIGVIFLIVLCFVYTDTETALLLSFIIVITVALVWLVVFLWKRRKARKAGEAFSEALEVQARESDTVPFKKNFLQAIQMIRRSKVGQTSGSQALYSLPWYVIIGNPSAGKSSAIAHSGLKFPLADQTGPVRGVGGTRNCDWFFTTEGILLDTAGRYTIHEGKKENHSEWLSFLGMLKRYRPHAPINGIIIAISISELSGANPEFGIELAKNLRQRLQELTDKLEVFAPVYIIFTKADLIAGFSEFFAEIDEHSRDHVWGTTLPYHEQGDAVDLFDKHFDILHRGLKDLSTAQLAAHSKHTLHSGVFTFPLEFAAVKPALRMFLATLFEQNPYQHKPVFRGFYFTSALQEGKVQSKATPRLKEYFGLRGEETPAIRTNADAKTGFFIKYLFSKVIFADKQLVLQHINPKKLRFRYLSFFAMMLALGLLLGGWVWSYFGNRQLTEEVRRDLERAVEVQSNKSNLAPRLEAMLILQRRIEQLEDLERGHSFSVGLGLYQGKTLKEKLLSEYYNGLRQIMIEPVQHSLEEFLGKANQGELHVLSSQTPSVTQVSFIEETRYKDPSPDDQQDVYNALKTYLMMASSEHVEAGHLQTQITMFWRNWLVTNRGNMPLEKLLFEDASSITMFYATRARDAQWPKIENRPGLVSGIRSKLSAAVNRQRPEERIYFNIKAKANTRPSLTVAQIVGDTDANLLVGSYALSGAFTRESWFEFVEPRFREAAKKGVETSDWVLGATVKTDMTLSYSQDEIFNMLSDLYKKDYVAEWQKFLGGVSVKPFADFTKATEGMNRLSNPQVSPLYKLLKEAFEQTVWDNPPMLARTQGEVGWFKRLFSRKTPPRDAQAGLIGQKFSYLAKVMVADDKGQSPLSNYMDKLSAIRDRLNSIHDGGDAGTGAINLMGETLKSEQSESVLSIAKGYVDNNMLADLPDDEKNALRPLLIWPVLQSYAALIPEAEREINQIWVGEVYEPFNQKLAPKYPFTRGVGVGEASATEIATIFGPDGAISRFISKTLAPLVKHTGNTMTSRTWPDRGINLRMEFTSNFAEWIAPAGGVSPGSLPQTNLRIQPQPAADVSEYTIEIAGQRLSYRNGPKQWSVFSWPNGQSTPVVRLTATTTEGQTITVFDRQGEYALKQMGEAATASRKNEDGQSYTITWTNSGVTIPLIIERSDSVGSGGKKGFDNLRLPSSIVGESVMPSAPTPVPPPQQEGILQ